MFDQLLNSYLIYLESRENARSSTTHFQPSQSLSLGALFREEFGSATEAETLVNLECIRTRILQLKLDTILAGIPCSTFTRHLWAHTKGLTFATEAHLYQWIWRHILVNILHKGTIISWSKSVKTKDCRFSMQEKVNFFHALNHPINKPKTINSKSEIYGTCSCKTRFLWPCAVGKEGADEVIT